MSGMTDDQARELRRLAGLLCAFPGSRDSGERVPGFTNPMTVGVLELNLLRVASELNRGTVHTGTATEWIEVATRTLQRLEEATALPGSSLVPVQVRALLEIAAALDQLPQDLEVDQAPPGHASTDGVTVADVAAQLRALAAPDREVPIDRTVAARWIHFSHQAHTRLRQLVGGGHR